MSRRPRGRTAAVWLLAVSAVVAAAGPATAASPGGADRSAQVQAMLDRVLGPGNSVVEIVATVRAGRRSTSSVTWGNALPASVEGFTVRTATGSSSGSSQVDAVDRSTTTLVDPPGALVRQTVAVAVDRRATAGLPLARLRRLVGSAAGVTRSRGDRLYILRTTFARAAAPTAPPAWTDRHLPLAVPAIEIGGGLVAVLVVVLALRGGRSRRRDLGRS